MSKTPEQAFPYEFCEIENTYFVEQLRTKNTPGRTIYHIPLVNQTISQEMEHWNWLKWVNITYT